MILCVLILMFYYFFFNSGGKFICSSLYSKYVTAKCIVHR